jgi:hypothetical protein
MSRLCQRSGFQEWESMNHTFPLLEAKSEKYLLQEVALNKLETGPFSDYKIALFTIFLVFHFLFGK